MVQHMADQVHNFPNCEKRIAKWGGFFVDGGGGWIKKATSVYLLVAEEIWGRLSTGYLV